MSKGDYKVGYGKPPVETQFKPGETGNARGRPPKKPKSLEATAKHVLEEKVRVTKKGKTIYVTKARLLLEQVVNGALGGDKVMLRYALPLLKYVDAAPDIEILPEDMAALSDLVASMGQKADE